MKLRDIIQVLDDIVIVRATSRRGYSQTVKTTSVSAEQKLAEFLDWEVRSIKATGTYTATLKGIGCIAWVYIAVKETDY